MAEMTRVQVIKTFFGMKPGETLLEFMGELKTLTPEEKKWMADEAARELNVTIKE